MATVLFFHPPPGPDARVVAFADALRAAGHTVHTPDLFGGRTFASIEEGLAFTHADEPRTSTRSPTRRPHHCRRTWSTSASRSASCPPSGSPRRVPVLRGRCCASPASPSRGSGRSDPGPTASRCRSTAWMPTRSSPARATSTPPASWCRWFPDAELFVYPGDVASLRGLVAAAVRRGRHGVADHPRPGAARPSWVMPATAAVCVGK